MTAPFAQVFGAALLQPHPQFDAIIEIDSLELLDIVRRVDDRLAEAESDRKVLEVSRRAHHDGIGAAIVGERHAVSSG